MNVNSPEEREIAKNCVAFCGALRRVEQQLRSEENSDAIIDGVLQAAAEFYGASRASIVEADWELGVGIITHEWCADGVEHQKDTLIRDAVLRRFFFLIRSVRSCDGGFDLFSFGAGQLFLFGQFDTPPGLTGFAAPERHKNCWSYTGAASASGSTRGRCCG